MMFIPIRPTKPITHRKLDLGLWAMPINRLQDFYEYSKQERPYDGPGYSDVQTVECCDTDRRSDVFGAY